MPTKTRQSLRSLFDHLALGYPVRIAGADLKRLLDETSIAALRQCGFLVEDEPLRFDPETGEEIFADDGRLFAFPVEEGVSRAAVEAKALRVWRFNIPRLLEECGQAFGLDTDVKEILASKLWSVGSKKIAGKTIKFLYSRVDINENLVLVKNLTDAEPVAVFANDDVNHIAPANRIAILPLPQLVAFKDRGLRWDKDAFEEALQSALIRTFFNKTNGDIVVDGAVVGNVLPGSAEYYFAAILWDRFEKPIRRFKTIARRRCVKSTSRPHRHSAEK